MAKRKNYKVIIRYDNLVRDVERLPTQKLKGEIIKIRRPLQIIVPLKLRHDKYDNNDNNENDNVNSHSLNRRGDLDYLPNKTDLRRYDKIKTCRLNFIKFS